ncbi:MAG: cellulase family glycosylhydrolase [Candidatus Marinimicrobia bacterium]|nr:cellulase family glycosylhydrolase [Candidatus Neomarinimicrobiota bacterium]MCF7882010.1 cellulase family glycosylhydrolase [Candidatus Neomarinimicrobiota bacterium]
MKRTLCYMAVSVAFVVSTVPANGFLHTEGAKIVNTEGEEVLLRGFGLGGWLVPEGYMLKVPGYGSPTTIRNRIIDLIGEDGAEEFYGIYRENYVAKQDIDTIASWGVNSIRLPMHYRLLSPEQGVYNEAGFGFIDSLLSWCESNQLYLILDMHCAPGGQNSDNISDSDGEAKLWTQPENQDHLVELWRTLADRYAGEEWIGGYDLINEPVMPDGYTNSDLRKLYLRLKNAVREVDTNHMIFIEGNWYATDFSEMTPPFDGNMVYAFHKYWNETNTASISQYLNIRKKWGVPLWLGESGENSNPWFYQTIALMEENNIGWNWWTHKKVDTHTSPYSVHRTEGYNDILDYWNGNAEKPGESVARQALVEFAHKFALDSCDFRPDVLAAIVNRESAAKPQPYTKLTLPGTISGVHYDIGMQGSAYYDTEYIKTRWDADQPWNKGYNYRNDGVDITEVEYDDELVYAIGHIEGGEWVTYTIDVPYDGEYDVACVIAGESAGGQLQLFLDGEPLTSQVDVPETGGWEEWKSLSLGEMELPAGEHTIKLLFHQGGFNFLRFRFTAKENDTFGAVDSHTLIGNNFPNPFNSETSIPILVSRESDAVVRVYDISGALVSTVFHGLLAEGEQTIMWDGQNNEGAPASSGIYFYELNIRGEKRVQDMLLVR